MSSMIYTIIRSEVSNGRLRQPFNVADVKRATRVMDKSPSFLSKHAQNNPGGHKEYFIRVSKGYYKLK